MKHSSTAAKTLHGAACAAAALVFTACGTGGDDSAVGGAAGVGGVTQSGSGGSVAGSSGTPGVGGAPGVGGVLGTGGASEVGGAQGGTPPASGGEPASGGSGGTSSGGVGGIIGDVDADPATASDADFRAWCLVGCEKGLTLDCNDDDLPTCVDGCTAELLAEADPCRAELATYVKCAAAHPVEHYECAYGEWDLKIGYCPDEWLFYWNCWQARPV